jgi:hypothetical protein
MLRGLRERGARFSGVAGQELGRNWVGVIRCRSPNLGHLQVSSWAEIVSKN